MAIRAVFLAFIISNFFFYMGYKKVTAFSPFQVWLLRKNVLRYSSDRL